MGRVSRYKKVKSIDPFAKNGSWKSDVGDCATLRRVKRKSKTALKMKEQKMNKLQRRMRGKNSAGGAGNKKSGGSNGWGDDDGYDLPPEGGDEFDMNDLIGSVKKQKHKANPLFDASSASHMVTVTPSAGGDEKWTRKVAKVDLRGVGVASGGNEPNDNAQSSKNKKSASKGANKKSDGTLAITAKTPTREIIAACSNPKSHKQANKDTTSSSTGKTKQEKRKAFLEKKKLKKRKRSNNELFDDDDNGGDHAKQQALQSLHSQSSSSQQQKTIKAPKKHTVKQQNYSDTMIARTTMDDQVERPPTFTVLPRGANKLSKNKKANKKTTASSSEVMKDKGEEDEHEKSKRIRKEQLALEAMREKVMKQYALLRESRRNRG